MGVLFQEEERDPRNRHQVLNEVQRQREAKILMIRSDNGTEFKNFTLEEFLSDEGIKHQYSAAYTPSTKWCIREEE